MVATRAGPRAPGHAISSRPVSVRGVVCKRSPVARAQDENPFIKLGSQLVQAGSQFTATFTGTTRIARKNVVKDDVVFVAGASGRVGLKVVKECAKAGYTVRAGVRTKEKGQDLIENIRNEGELTAQQVRKIRIEEFDLFDPDTVAPAIGNAACVVCAIGAPEDKPFDSSLPRRVDGEAAITLIKIAAKQSVKRFMMISSLGTTKLGFPAGLLNLFWGVLYWKQQAENELIRSGMLYTIIRPGGMERPTDSYKDTHNTVMYPRDQMFGGQISRLQVAEVVAACIGGGDLSANKTIEVIASNVAPPRTLEEMLEEQPVEITVEELREKQAEIADVRNRADTCSKEADELEAKLAEAEEKKIKAEAAFSAARGSLEEVKAETADVLKASSEAQRTIVQLKLQRDQATLQETAAKAVLDAQRAAQREFKVLTAMEIRDVADAVLKAPSEAAAVGASSKPANPLAGLFGAAPKKEKEEVAEEPPEAAAKPSKPASPFAGLFGGPAKKAEKEKAAPPEQAPAEVKAKAPVAKAAAKAAPAPAKAKAAPAKAKAAAPTKAAAPAKQEAEDTTEETVKVKGGGLFGFFQQDTVYADDGEEAVPPATEVVERAVTKRGTGRKSVKELIGRKDTEEADAPVAAKAAAPAPAPKKAPPPPPPKKKSPPPSPAAAPGAESAEALAAKREKAVAAALTNLGAAAKKVGEAEVKEVEAKVETKVKEVEKKVEKTAKQMKQKASPVSSNGSAPVRGKKAVAASKAAYAGDSAGAQVWIKNWRSKQSGAAGSSAPASSAGTSAPAAQFSADRAGAQAWIKNWRSKNKAPAFSLKFW